MLKHVAYRSTSSLGRASTDMTCRSSSLSPDTMSLKGDVHSPDLSLKRPSIISQDTMSLKDDPMSDNLSLKGDMSLKSFSPDTISLHSTVSFTSLATGRLSSRCSSTASLNEQQTTPVKVYLRSLRPDFEYKTMKLSTATTCRQLIVLLLTKFRLKHRDPNLFFVTMEVTVRASGGGAPTRRLLVLDDQARPAELQQCRPRGDARFSIGVRRGGLLRIHDSILMSGSQYKSLLVSYRTTAEELVQLLLNCYGNKENPMHYSVHEVNKNPYTDRPLRPDECPLSVQSEWPRAARQNYAFVLRRNVSYALSLKSRVSWRRSLDQSSTDTESEHEDHNTTITSLLSNSSVSSALSISSEGSLSSNASVMSSGSLSSNVSVSSNGSSSSSGVSSTCSSALVSPIASPIKKPPVSPNSPEAPSSRTALTSKPPAPPPASCSPSKFNSSSHSTPTSAPTPVPRTILNTSTTTNSLSAKPQTALLSAEGPTVPSPSSSTSVVSSPSSCNGTATTTVTTSSPKSSSSATNNLSPSSPSSSSSPSSNPPSTSAKPSSSSSSTTRDSVSPRKTQVPPMGDDTAGASSSPPPYPPPPPPPPVPMRRTSCCPNYENCFYI